MRYLFTNTQVEEIEEDLEELRDELDQEEIINEMNDHGLSPEDMEKLQN